MKKKSLILILLVVSLILNVAQFVFSQLGIFPYWLKEAVPNEETAIKIAEAIWLPIYGNDIYNSTPFTAEYDKTKKIWRVYGTLGKSNEEYLVLGGVPEIEIRKKDGKILYLNHGM